MKVNDDTSEVLGRNFELSIDDAERLYNIGNFEKFSYSKIMSRAGQDLLLETAKTPVRLLGAVGQIPYAVETGAKFIRDRLPSSVKTDGNVIFGGETAINIMGKAKSVGDTLMEVSGRTLDEINKRAEKVLPKLSPEEQESTFNTYAQVGTQLSALLGLSMMSPKAGLDYITALTLGGETEEGFETYKAKNKGSMEGYGEQAGKDLFANLANTAIQRKIEGLIGVPGKMKFFRSAKELGRAGLYSWGTGWLEEGSQALTDAIIDDFNGRLEGQVDKDGKPLTWWTKWLSQIQEINATAFVEGAMGVGFALNNRASVKNEIKSIVEKHVEPEKVNEVVNSVYDSMDLSVKNVVAKELEMSSSLQTKRGEVYESLYKAALEQVKAAKEQGGFPELQTEEDIANYVKSVADDFADETLAEAHRRNTVIEDVLDPSLIRYENGQLVMPMTKGTESEEEVLHQFAGVKAKTAALDKLDSAKKLELEGVDNEQMRQQTGWFKGPDDKWRFEISDKDARFVDRYDIKFDMEVKNGKTALNTTLGNILIHDRLYEAYPELRDMPVEVSTEKTKEKGAYQGGKFYLNMDGIVSGDGLGVLMHEIQHYIQDKESFARGGSPYEFIDKEWLRSIEDEISDIEGRIADGEDLASVLAEKKEELRSALQYAQDEYNRFSGEYEAEQTRKRMRYSDEQRMDEKPFGEDDLIVILGEEEFSYRQQSISDENIYGATNSNEEPIANPANFNVFIEGSRVTENDEPVSPSNPPKKIYRGDTRYFEEYEEQENAYEYDWGRAFYLSDNLDDILTNYQSGGADLKNRIDREAEQLADEEDIDYDEAREKVRQKYEQEDIVREFYLSIKEPVIIGGDKETFFDYTEEYNEETDEYGEPEGKGFELIGAIENYLYDIGADDYVQTIVGTLQQEMMDNGGLTASQVEDTIRGIEEVNYLIDYESGVGELLSSAFGAIGFDGIIDHRAGTKFRNMNMGPDTTHYIVFNSEQAKSVDNKGEWGVSEKNFYKQGEKGSIQFKGDRALITLTEEANSSTLAHELAHYWLQNTFLYSKSGLATPEYKQFFNSIAKYLDITDDQETIKEWQQEKWARAAEMYAMGKAPEGMEKPLTQYQQWIRKAYGEVSEPMYIDENGEAKVPEFDFETMKMFANLAGETLTEPEFKQKQEAVRGLAKSTNQMAQAKGMKTELPTYEKRSATDMGKKADEFIQRDKQLAIDIVKGLKPEQEGLFRQDLFAALRELALNEGDSDLLNELSKSMTVEEATELGQRIQALARGRIDPVKQMVELRDERMKKNKVDKKKLKEETEKAKKEIKKEMAEASTPKEWADFIKSLEC